MRSLLVLMALGGPALPLAAQPPPVVAVGSKIRLHLPAGDGTFLPRFDGTIVRISGDTLVLRPKQGGGSRLYTPSNDSQLLVLTGHRPSVARGATIGALVGVLTAGFVATLAGPACNGDGVLCYIRRHVSVRNAVVLGGAGMVMGATIGALKPRRIWTRAWLPESTAGFAVGAGGFGLGVSIPF
jgi:hypothetical protein